MTMTSMTSLHLMYKLLGIFATSDERFRISWKVVISAVVQHLYKVA